MFEDVRLGPAFRKMVCTQRTPLRDALLAEERRFADEIIRSMGEEEIVIPMPESLVSRSLCFQIDLLRAASKKSIEMAVYDAQEELILRDVFPLNDEMNSFRYFTRYWESAAGGVMTAGCKVLPEQMIEFDGVRKGSHKDGTGLFSEIGEEMGLDIPYSLSRQFFEFTASLWPHSRNPLPQSLLQDNGAYEPHYA